MKYELALGRSRLLLDSSSLTIKSIRRIDKELDLAVAEFLEGINNKLKLINELNENYKEVFTRKEEETDEEYAERTKVPTEEINNKAKDIVGEDGIDSLYPLAFSALRIFASLEHQEDKVTAESFDNACWDEVITFILEFSKKGKLRFRGVFEEYIKKLD